MDLDEAELLRRDAPVPIRCRHQVHILGVQQLLAAHPSNNTQYRPNQPLSSPRSHQIERRERRGGVDEAYQCDDVQKLAAIVDPRSRRAYGVSRRPNRWRRNPGGGDPSQPD